ncbi:copper resistance CopC family protein [uncultured Nitrosomonas sp.]|uniref:copper resistance CopC family protein n=1 Tax=uncultured Nitrosomonas sp. TaxID=156424 RepID=UPI0025F1059F|nr:copper resistance CopC family protein [uncultured Nitrosomonas sp.]
MIIGRIIAKHRGKIVRNKRLSKYGVGRVTAFAVVVILFSLLSQVNSVMAHATLVKSDPPRRAMLSTSPKQIQLWFNEKIEGSYASVTVEDSNKKLVTENIPEAITDDPKSIVLNLPQIQPGRYTVHYRVMSVDGHVIESEYDFSIKK